MHYYQYNIADYRKDTAHLTPIEHYIYRSLMDWYYLDEQPIPKITQVVIRRLGLGLEQEPNLLNVLSDFFVLEENGYHQGRIDKEIAAYHSKAEKNKVNGMQGGRPKKTQSVILDNPSESQNNPNHKPLTNNHKPVKSKAIATATRLPEDWKPSEVEIQFCKTNRPDLDANLIADGFRDFWISVAGAKGRKENWTATWRNWVRNQRQGNQNVTTHRSIHDERANTIAELTGQNRKQADIEGSATRLD